MNYGTTLLALLALSVFFLIITTLLFYLRHLASRQFAANNTLVSEGRYFKRYIPEQLRSSYDGKNTRIHKLSIHGRAVLVKLSNAMIIMIAAGFSFYAIFSKFDVYLKPIDLTKAEISRLDYSHYKWHREIDMQLPNLHSVISQMKSHVFIVPYAEEDKSWLVNGLDMRRVAFDNWENFKAEIHFSMIECDWKSFQLCRAKNPSAIILLLPGHWDDAVVDAALRKGASIIAYGPPAKLFSPSVRSLEWHGLTFMPVIKTDGGPLVLLGDRLLTLGFDAGLILATDFTYKNFQAYSSNPQAISINDDYEAGGNHATRLYAKTIGSGRLVWMDFPPAVMNNGPRINVKHLHAVMASVLRYLSKQTYSALATWPGARSFGALIEEDTEFKFTDAKRVNEMLEQMSAPVSWFILSNLAQKHRILTRDLAKNGEIACHGDNHADFTKNDLREQTIRISRCQKVLKEITGIRPLAFRPPEEKYDTFTIDAIANSGMDHFIANNSPDRAVPEILTTQDDSKSLVSIPRMVTDDFGMWHIRHLNHEDSLRLVDNEISWMHRAHGIYMFSFHSQNMDTKDNLDTIKHIVSSVRKFNAYFATSSDIAAWWRFRTNLQSGKKVELHNFKRFNPVMMAVNKQGLLMRLPYFSNNSTPINLRTDDVK